MKKILLAGFVVLLAVSGCGDKSSQTAGAPKAAETGKAADAAPKPEGAAPAASQPQAGGKESREAILARHMKCREEKGADCFKILEEAKGEAPAAAVAAAQPPADKKAHNDAVMTKHMKCRQEKGADCFKILEEMQK